MSHKQQLLAIAKDAVKQLKTKQFRVGAGTFCALKNAFNPTLAKADLQSNMRVTKGCTVCADGALFLSMVRLYDGVKLDGIGTVNVDDVPHQLAAKIGKKQTVLIEIAFEKGKGYFDPSYPRLNNNLVNLPSGQADRAIKFGKKHRAQKKRFLAICKNISANKGVFKP